MFGRRKDPQAAAPTSSEPSGPGKGKPTPRRREVEAARKQPLVPTARATGGKGGGKAARGAARAERARSRELMLSGDERYLPARDKGPVRRFVRDTVDARWSLGEFLLPAMLLVLVLSFVSSSLKLAPGFTTAVFAIVYLVVLAAIIDAFLMTRRLKKAIVTRFGEAAFLRGTGMYGVMRAFQLRRTRVPKPTVARGEHPSS